MGLSSQCSSLLEILLLSLNQWQFAFLRSSLILSERESLCY